MRLCDLVQDLSGQIIGDVGAYVEISDVVDDSRQVTPGSIFIARAGAATDGARFIDEAVSRGAVALLTDRTTATSASLPTLRSADVPRAAAVLAERFFDHPSRALRLIGVTGTNGKTTIAHLTQQILNFCGVQCGLIGTVVVDDGATRAPAHLTTPGAIEISRILARTRDHGCAAAVMEVSSHAIEQRRTSALAFDVAVFTNLSGDHLDYHGNMDAYADAKAQLFADLAPHAAAVVNQLDPAWRRMIRDCRAPVIGCSTRDRSAAATIQGELSIEGAEVSVSGPWGEIRSRIRLLGEHNLMNLLQAIAAAHAIGADVSGLGARLHELAPPPGRFEPVRVDGVVGPTVLVDYAHTDDALDNAIRAVRAVVPKGGRLWVVFGCGGDRDATKRPRMGAVAARLADQVVITSDNPRRENPDTIINQVLEGVPAPQRPKVTVEPDRAAAIERAALHAKPIDVILIAGKGHEDYQLVSDGAGGVRRRDFDDRVEARRALEKRRERAHAVAVSA